MGQVAYQEKDSSRFKYETLTTSPRVIGSLSRQTIEQTLACKRTRSYLCNHA